MSARVDLKRLNQLERAARQEWLGHAAHHHFGACHTCGRTHDENGHPLYVARQPRRRDFECLDCWAARA